MENVKAPRLKLLKNNGNINVTFFKHYILFDLKALNVANCYIFESTREPQKSNMGGEYLVFSMN